MRKKEEGLSYIAYFRTDGGSPKLYTEEYVNELEEENTELQQEIERQSKAQCILDDEITELQTKIDNAIEEINYMITNADITEISAIKLKQILGDKE